MRRHVRACGAYSGHPIHPRYCWSQTKPLSFLSSTFEPYSSGFPSSPCPTTSFFRFSCRFPWFFQGHVQPCSILVQCFSLELQFTSLQDLIFQDFFVFLTYLAIQCYQGWEKASASIFAPFCVCTAHLTFTSQTWHIWRSYLIMVSSCIWFHCLSISTNSSSDNVSFQSHNSIIEHLIRFRWCQNYFFRQQPILCSKLVHVTHTLQLERTCWELVS